MPNYAIWVCNDDYSRRVLLANAGNARTWSRLTYRQAVNDLESCTIELVPNSPKIADISLMKRLLIYRDGVIVFGGLLERERWKIGPTAPQGDSYTLNARSAAEYADWRITVPGAGQEHDVKSGPLDDVAKAYVRNHMADLADAARQVGGLSVQADVGAAASDTVRARYEQLLLLLQKLAIAGGFDWRFVPMANGCEFRTAYPRWGIDRRKGNGINHEMVFSLDRRNFTEMTYVRDLLGHYNHLYVGGQGEGVDRLIVEREDAAAVTAYKRRERFHSDTRYSLASSLEAQGDIHLAKLAPVEAMTVKPAPGVWPDQFGLGDVVTCYANRYGRTFRFDGKVAALLIEITPDSIESVTPELEAVA